MELRASYEHRLPLQPCICDGDLIEVHLTRELRDIVLSCGQAFGIDLYGMDIIESGGKPYVVDMCSIPGFMGVPDAPQRRGTSAPPEASGRRTD